MIPDLKFPKGLYIIFKKNYLTTKNIDLPRKVRYKVRKKKSYYEKNKENKR